MLTNVDILAEKPIEFTQLFSDHTLRMWKFKAPSSGQKAKE